MNKKNSFIFLTYIDNSNIIIWNSIKEKADALVSHLG